MNTILEWLEETAERIPENIAAEDALESVSWGELLAAARRGGTFLSRFVNKNRPVVLMTRKNCRSLELLYSVLYSGGFYVFVDPDQPVLRVQKILRRLQASVVIAEKEDMGKAAVPGFPGAVLCADRIFCEEADAGKLEKIRKAAAPEDPLYTVFTSGSTGEPKGITVSHLAVMKFILHFAELSGISDRDTIGNQAPFDFDVSVKDIFVSCLTGARMVLIPRSCFAMPGEMVDFLVDKNITVLVWAVSALCMISSFGGFDYRIPDKIRLVMFSGEVMPAHQLAVWQKALPNASFVNLYGPSEITCNCTYFPVPHNFPEDAVLPIGTAFPGRRVFLLDDSMREVREPGAKGQICVGGESLSDGYCRDPERTAERFVFREGQRIYLTGDIGYFDQSGLLYFAGRKDDQIKHMGHRIELGEVEHAMEQVDGIRCACCVFDPAGNRVAGFYIGEPDRKEMRCRLKQILPAYMVPGRLIRKQVFPLTEHGKTDRKKLLKEVQDRHE